VSVWLLRSVCLYTCTIGWWLSLSRQDDFLHRQGFVSEDSRLIDDPTRFAKFNAKTLGFVLVSVASTRNKVFSILIYNSRKITVKRPKFWLQEISLLFDGFVAF